MYNIGILNNWKQVAGSNIFLWFWPTSPEGDGYHYPTELTLHRAL